jgi:phage gp29-like protein
VPLGLKVGMSTIRDKIGLPDPGKDEELLKPQTVGNATPQTEDAPAVATQSVAAKPDTDAIDRAAADIVASDWEEITLPLVDGLDDELGAATSIEEAQAILAKRVGSMGVNAFVELLARAAFAARMSGEADEPLS